MRVPPHPTRFRRREHPVTAIQYWPGPEGNCDDIAEFIGDGTTCDEPCNTETVWIVQTSRGEEELKPGDWICKGIRGIAGVADLLVDEHFPVDQHIFDAEFVPSDERTTRDRVIAAEALLDASRNADDSAVAAWLDRLADETAKGNG